MRISLRYRLPLLLLVLHPACVGTGETVRVDAHLSVALSFHGFPCSYHPSHPRTQVLGVDA